MRIILLILLLGICFSESEKYEDVIYLKDGSVIYGTIIEIKPNEYYKIKSGRNIFVFQLNEIDIIKKELITNTEEEEKEILNIKNRNGVIGIGVPITNLSASFVTISGNFQVSNTSTFSPYLGILPYTYGISYDYHQNYNDDGVRFSFSIGQWYDDWEGEWMGQETISCGYQ